MRALSQDRSKRADDAAYGTGDFRRIRFQVSPAQAVISSGFSGSAAPVGGPCVSRNCQRISRRRSVEVSA